MILPKGHHSLTTGNIVKDICRPLFDSTEISYFHYAKLYDNAKTCTLITNPEFHEHFWKQGYEKEVFKNYYEGIFFHEQCSSQILKEGIQFNVDHLLMIITRYSNYYEIFGFGTTPGNDSVLSFYFNHMDVLKKFALYFKERGEDLIQAASKNLVRVEGYSIKGMKDFKSLNEFNETFNFVPKRFRFHTNLGEILITSKEFEILKLMAQGYSGKEMANQLHVVLKTIETHVSHIKSKLGYTRRSDLVKCFLRSPYSDIAAHDVL